MSTTDPGGLMQARSIEPMPVWANEARLQGVLVGEIEEVEEAGKGPSLVSNLDVSRVRLPDSDRSSPRRAPFINRSTAWMARRWSPERVTDCYGVEGVIRWGKSNYKPDVLRALVRFFRFEGGQ
jgi:hypothetical protein